MASIGTAEAMKELYRVKYSVIGHDDLLNRAAGAFNHVANQDHSGQESPLFNGTQHSFGGARLITLDDLSPLAISLNGWTSDAEMAAVRRLRSAVENNGGALNPFEMADLIYRDGAYGNALFELQ